MVLYVKIKRKQMTMQSTFRQQFNTIATKAVQMHGSWLAINSLPKSDRTPEGYISSGSLKGEKIPRI
jgi:hypothetical protein